MIYFLLVVGNTYKLFLHVNNIIKNIKLHK